MQADYRYTWNPSKNQMMVTAATRGYDAILGQEAAEIILMLQKDPSFLSQAIKNYPAFIRKAQGHGWINNDGLLAGQVRTVQKDPHLNRLQIELSTKCNFKCTYCYSESGPNKSDRLSQEMIRQVITDADKMGVTHIDLTGGEVLIYKGWENVLAQARNLGLVASVHSNGLLLSDRNVEILSAHGVRQLQVTVESHLPQVHVAVGRGSTSSFEKVINGIKRAQGAGIKVRVAALVHKKNVNHIQEAVKWFRDELGTSVYLDRIIPSGPAGAADLSITESEFWTAISPLIGLGAQATRICDTSEVTTDAVEPECGVAHSFVYLTADGHYSLCPTMTHREEERFRGPHINEYSLPDAWYTSNLFSKYRGTNCENTTVCPAAKQCGGGCRSNAYLATGRLNAPDVIACNVNKNSGPVFVDFLNRYKNNQFSVLENTHGK